MLALAAIVAILLGNEFIHINWQWQFVIWSLAFFLALEEYRYSLTIFLLDASISFVLCTLCPVVNPLGAAALLTVALSAVRIDVNKIRRQMCWLLLFLVFLVVYDILVVSFVYPHMEGFVKKMTILVYERDLSDEGWGPFLGCGDFVIAGFLTFIFQLRWWQAAIAFLSAIVILIHIPIKAEIMVPALPFIIAAFLAAKLLTMLPTTPLPLISGRGLRGLYWVSKMKYNDKGDLRDGKSETL